MSSIHKPLVEQLPLNDNGWMVNDEGSITPIWYSCSQLPPSMCKKRRNKGKKAQSSRLQKSCELPTISDQRSEKCVPDQDVVSFHDLEEEEEEDQSDWEHLSDLTPHVIQAVTRTGHYNYDGKERGWYTFYYHGTNGLYKLE